MHTILKCTVCGKYTFQKVCCDKETASVLPPRYTKRMSSAVYRRKARVESLKAKGLLK